MSVPTVAVTCRAASQTGEPIPKARFVAKLNGTAQYNGFVVPKEVTAYADVDGVCVLHLFPTELAPNGLTYEIKAYDGSAKSFLRVNAAVPNAPCFLDEIIQLEPFPSVDQAQQALTGAQAAAAAARVDRLLTDANADQTGEDRTAVAESAALVIDVAEQFGDVATAVIEAEAAAALATTNGAAQVTLATTQAGIATTGAGTATTAAGTATTQAGIATTKAGEATTNGAAQVALAAGQVVLATDQKTLAVTARTGAESARDAAIIGAGVYATEALGRAAVADGAAFKVQGAGDIAAYEYRRTNSSTSVLIATYPSAAAVSSLVKAAPDGYAFSILDDEGKASVLIANDGTAVIADLQVDNLSAGSFTPAQLALTGASGIVLRDASVPSVEAILSDSEGKGAMAVRADGTVVMAAVASSVINSQYAYPRYGDLNCGYDINHIVTYGQSNSSGGTGTTTLSQGQKYDALMFSGGIQPHLTSSDPAVEYASFVPLIEVTGRETPTCGTAQYLKDLVAAEHPDFDLGSFRVLASGAGQASMSVAQLSKGGAYYSRFMEQVSYGYSLSQAGGLSYAMRAFTWTQGEADVSTTQSSYVTSLQQLVNDVQSDVQALTAQAEPVYCISWQVAAHGPANRPNSALAQLQLSQSDPRVVIACPEYFAAMGADNLHLVNPYSKILGGYYGLAYKRVVLEGGSWSPLAPIGAIRQGKICIVKFHVPAAPLVFDTDLVTAAANQGFSLVDAAGNPIAITAVSIIKPDRVKVTAATTIPTGAKLRYGFSGTVTAGRDAGPRGNLRDSQGASLVFDFESFSYPMHNWCLIFEQPIT